MKRMQLFEFEDLAWFPDFIRRGLTAYLATLHRVFGTPEMLAPLLSRVLQRTRTTHILDLCSGNGGVMLETVRLLRERYGQSIHLTLTDLYPNLEVASTINNSGQTWLRYATHPVDAGQVEAQHQGLRTMVCAFHHMPPTVAKSILKDAFTQRQPICIYEISDNSSPKWLWWLAFPVGIILVLIVTLMMRPMKGQQLFFTYIIPILPIFISWDGAVSNARTYTESDLKELLHDLQAPDYTWEIGTLTKAPNPGKSLYLIGFKN